MNGSRRWAVAVRTPRQWQSPPPCRPISIGKAMAAGEVAVIPGFQGLTEDERVTTLGRGGSDTSAVAVAAAMQADLDRQGNGCRRGCGHSRFPGPDRG